MDRMRVHPLAELCVTAVDEETIAELNAKWMEKEGPTDVLAFPMDELRPGLVNEEPEEGVLGDLVLCPSVAAGQAKTAGHSPTDELDLLTVHGILHLLGYDHAEPEEHKEMFGLQARLLGGVGRPRRRSIPRRTGVTRDEPEMSGDSPGLILPSSALVVLAAVLTTVEAALSSFSRARAVELAHEQRPGAIALLRLLDDAAHHLNALLVLRLLTETSAVVLSDGDGPRPARARRSGPRCSPRSG